MYVRAANATLDNNRIFSNTARWGGGVYLWARHSTLTSNLVRANTARWGGGIYLESSSMASLVGNLFSANTAEKDGGGLFLQESDAALYANDIVANQVGEWGGGLYMYRSAARLMGNRITGNGAVRNGGGAYLWASDAHFDGNLLVANTAEKGGGLYLGNSGAVLSNTVVADNQASLAGSGLYAQSSTPRLLHTTIARNGAAAPGTGDGCGLWITGDGGVDSHVTLTNTILVGHRVGITVAAGSAVTLEATLWGEGAWANEADGNGAGAIVTGTPAYNYWGPPAFVDPDGGDYHVGPGSAALDGGVEASVDRDMDGELRPAGAAPDLGADEWPAALNVGLRAYPDPVYAGAPLTFTVRVTNTGNVPLHTTVTLTPPDHVTPGGDSTWTPVLAPGAVWEEGMTATVEAGYTGLLTVVAVISTVEGVMGELIETMQVLAPPAPDLTIGLCAHPAVAPMGAALTYTVRITNTGNLTLHGTVTHTLPEQVAPDETLIWMPVVPPGGVWEETVQVTIEEGYVGPLTSDVEITTAEGAAGAAVSKVMVVEADQIITVGAEQEGHIVAPTPNGGRIDIQVPAGAVSEPTQLVYGAMASITDTLEGIVFIGSAFKLDAYRDGDLYAGLVFEKNITVTIRYTAADVEELDENTLELRYWRDSEWTADDITVIERDPVGRRLVVGVSHLTTFAAFAQPQSKTGYYIYLPSVNR